MAEIIKVYRQSLPSMKFVGKCYGEQDKENESYAGKWDEWFQNDLFSPLKLEETDEPFEDCDAFYGLFRCREGEPTQYWIGVFLSTSATVPDGYESLDFDGADFAVCWVYGKEPDIFFVDCFPKLDENGFKWAPDAQGTMWALERYVCPRYTTPDEKGNVILDMCFRIDA